MNRLVVLSSLILSLLIVSAVTIQADQPLPFIEDFEAYAAGKELKNWKVMNAGAGATATVVEGIPGANGKCLKMEGKSGIMLQAENGWEGPNPDRLIVVYRLMVSVFGPAGSIIAMLYITPPDLAEADKWAELGVCVAIIDDTLLNHDGAWTPLQKIELNKWYNLEYDIDMPKRVFDVYIEGEKKTNESPFRGKTATIDNTNRIWIFAREEITASYDDIFVFDAEGPDPRSVEAVGKLAVSWGKLKSTY